MLKIAEYNTITGEKVDLEKLRIYDFRIKYNEDTGCIKQLVSYRSEGIFCQRLFETIFYEYDGDYILDDKCVYDKAVKYRVDTDLLYELIKNGFIIKED